MLAENKIIDMKTYISLDQYFRNYWFSIFQIPDADNIILSEDIKLPSIKTKDRVVLVTLASHSIISSCKPGLTKLQFNETVLVGFLPHDTKAKVPKKISVRDMENPPWAIPWAFNCLSKIFEINLNSPDSFFL